MKVEVWISIDFLHYLTIEHIAPEGIFTHSDMNDMTANTIDNKSAFVQVIAKCKTW